MAAKYQLITELYRRTGVAVAKNPQAWQNFLSAACRNYKCRFDEQLLIYAQRPDAVAVAQLETWNKQFKRWVNKDSKGIAVFDSKGRRNTLKYYFDISDTHEGYYGSRPVPIWQMSERYEQAVIERLSDRFGDVESADLASVLMETAKNAVEDNLQDYMPQLKSCTQDSLLEELDEYNIEVIYRQLAVNSVAYMLMSRCGVDTEAVFEREDFAEIINFNTPATINALGIATSDISEMALREISQTIRDVQFAEKNKNRTFAPQSQTRYDVGREQAERSNHNERNHIHQTRGLSYSRPNITDRARNSAWQIRFDAQGLSGAAQTSDLPQPADIGRAEQTSLRSGTDSSYEVGASDKTALQGAGRDGGTERKSTDAMGRTDEQYPQSSGGNDTERADLQLNVADEQQVTVNLPTVEEQIEMLAEAEDEKSSAFVISQEDIDSVFLSGSGFQNGKYRIYRQFQKNEDSKGNIDFLKKEYGTGGGTHYFPDGTQGHTWHDGKGIAIEKYGSSATPDLVLSWAKVEKRLRELIKNDRYLNEKEKDHYADYLESEETPQYEIDTQRKMARQRFIDANRDLPPADKRDTLALRLSDFIRDLDGYEKDLLENVERTDLADVTAEQMEQHLGDPSTVQQLIDFLALVQGKTADVYSRSNAWRFSQELMELYPLRYVYHEDDVVYIGADKYEIAAFDENAVSLRNPDFPLFGKELSRADFEEKLKENPANDHLKVVVTEKQSVQTPSEEKPDGIKFSIGFSEHPAFYDRQFNDRYTDLSFALGNYLLGVLDEKQHRERESKDNVGWYHKTDFEITATIGGEDFHYEGRFDIGDGEGDLVKSLETDEAYGVGNNGEIFDVTFGLYAETDLTAADSTVIPADGLIEIISLDENGKGTVNSYLPFGSYYVKELSTNSAYVLNEQKYPVHFEYAGQDTAVVHLSANDGEAIENEIIYGSVSGLKSDEDGNALGGAVIGIFKTGTEEFTKENAIQTTTSADDGSFSFEKAPYGTWVIREIESPTGFVLSEEEIVVTVGKVDEVVEIELVNYFIKGNIELTKVDADYPDNKLTGAVFEVYADTNGNGEFDKDDELCGEMTELEGGVYQMTELRYGKYFVREKTVPDGFVLDDGVYGVSIEENGKTYTVENKAGVGFINDAQKGSLKIVKTSSDGKVEGFSFRVTSADGYDQTFKTDKNGEIFIEGLRIGEYTVSEVSDSASAGYILPADKQATVKTDSTTIVEMHNEFRDTPKTGDDFNLGLWVSLAAASVIGAGVLGFVGFKKKKKED
jgi:hypothetical protein